MSDVLVVHPLEVPLGEGDKVTVDRVMPQRGLSVIGGWCFLDHLTPGSSSVNGASATTEPADTLRVASHPHTCLQTVTWLFSGELTHRDSIGSELVVGPGEVAVMTAGRGITHTEYATPGVDLRGVQLWIALPDEDRFVEPHVEVFAPEPVRSGDHEVAIFIGELSWEDSPVEVYSPLVGAELRLASPDPFVVDVPDGWEYGVLADTAPLMVDGVEVRPGELAYVAPGRRRFTVAAHASAGEVVRAILIGGEPLAQDIIVWWNFVGRTHEEIATWRLDYQTSIGAETGGDASRFTPTPGPDPDTPAPSLPTGRLKPRARRHAAPPTQG